MDYGMPEGSVSAPLEEGRRRGPRFARGDGAWATSAANSVSNPRVSVVIPTLNEAADLPHLVGKLPAGLHEVVLVDGFSGDGSVEVAKRLRPDIRFVLQRRPGEGDALACGVAAATGDVIVVLDADGSADPAEIPRFVDALVAGADFA